MVIARPWRPVGSVPVVAQPGRIVGDRTPPSGCDLPFELEQRRPRGQVPPGAGKRGSKLRDLGFRRIPFDSAPAAVDDDRAAAVATISANAISPVDTPEPPSPPSPAAAAPASIPWPPSVPPPGMSGSNALPRRSGSWAPNRCDSAGAAAGVGSNVTQPMPRKNTSTQEWASKSWTTYEPFWLLGLPGAKPLTTRVGMPIIRSISAIEPENCWQYPD